MVSFESQRKGSPSSDLPLPSGYPLSLISIIDSNFVIARAVKFNFWRASCALDGEITKNSLCRNEHSTDINTEFRSLSISACWLRICNILYFFHHSKDGRRTWRNVNYERNQECPSSEVIFLISFATANHNVELKMVIDKYSYKREELNKRKIKIRAN